MRKNNFEIIVVADANQTDEEGQAVINKYKGIISTGGGEVKFESHWGRRRLAYEIQKKRHGIYHLLFIEGDGSLIEELERQFGYDEKILTFFVISVGNLEKSYNDFEALKADPQKNANMVKEIMGA